MKVTTVEEEKEAEASKVVEVKKEVSPKKEEIPFGYIPVKLDSLGKLSAPQVLHFRDYSIEEVLELADTSEEVNNLEVMVKVLNNMVHEDFDCGDLHLSELLEIVYTIQGSFYSAEIEKRLVVDENGDLKSKDNYISMTVPLSAIETKVLADEFNEPFTLTDPKTKTKVEFRLPRVKDKIVAEDYIQSKYFKETRQYSSIYNELKEIEGLASQTLREEKMYILEQEKPEEILKFKEYIVEKTKSLMTLTQGLSILSVNGEAIDYGDCGKILEIIPTVSRRIWETYIDICDKYDFGLVSDVTFFSNELNKEVTRSLAFRPMDFVSFNEEEGDSGITVSFS